MSETKDKIVDWLVKHGVAKESVKIPAEDAAGKANASIRDVIVVPYKVALRGKQKVTLGTNIEYGTYWIKIKMLLLSHVEIPAKVKAPLHEALLKANYDLNEVTYSLSPKGDVYIEADMPEDATFDNFESEYGAVEYGIDYFLKEICMSLQECMDIVLKNTYNPKGSSLYI